MTAAKTYWWTKAPFLRIIISLIAGIIFQWYYPFTIEVLIISGFVLFFVVSSYSLLPVSQRFRFSTLAGVCICLLVADVGAILTWKEDIRNDKQWFGHRLENHPKLIISLDEPLVEKAASYKAIAIVRYVSDSNTVHFAEGNVLLYIKKNAAKGLSYGSRIVVHKPLQTVRNSGNPGAFDYQRYCFFQGITHQIYLTERDFTILKGRDENALQKFLIQCRTSITAILKKYIKGDQETGLAEALLIGYKDDLDKSLVQAYSNTGVVHVIAISGLHIGLIYVLLIFLMRPLRRFKRMAWLRFIILLCILWLFTFLAGAQPSVLRSAVMFSCLAVGELISRRSSIYNSLAMSAFILLCINPFWLWDVGFQLSYAAVLSILIFFRPIYNWFYFPNKIIAWLWKLTAVTLAAQILTAPICIYHFHQFPTLFLLTNLIVVPLSSIILIGEILLCALAVIEPFASVAGLALTYCIRFMNNFIERFNDVSFAVWNGLSISVFQSFLLFLFITCCVYWFIEKRQNAFKYGLAFLLLFFLLRTYSFIEANKQQKVIIYNTPRYQGIDLIDGRMSYFAGDTALLQDELLYNYHLKPSRVLHRVNNTLFIPSPVSVLDFNGKKISIMDRNISFVSTPTKEKLDLVVLSRNPHIYINDIYKTFQVRQIVIDGSVPAWKARLWKRDCDSLQLPCYDVSEKGAFVINL